jgi:hypothetical protein
MTHKFVYAVIIGLIALLLPETVQIISYATKYHGSSKCRLIMTIPKLLHCQSCTV